MTAVRSIELTQQLCGPIEPLHIKESDSLCLRPVEPSDRSMELIESLVLWVGLPVSTCSRPGNEVWEWHPREIFLNVIRFGAYMCQSYKKKLLVYHKSTPQISQIKITGHILGPYDLYIYFSQTDCLNNEQSSSKPDTWQLCLWWACDLQTYSTIRSIVYRIYYPLMNP